MPPVPDLVRDSKLETIFCRGYTQHVYHVSGFTPRQRKMRKEERWVRGNNLGSGAFGTVWLEKLVAENGEEKYRAVKEIRKRVQRSEPIDYNRELEAIAKFSHERVRESFYIQVLPFFPVPSLSLASAIGSSQKGSMKYALRNHLDGMRTTTSCLSPWNTFLLAISKVTSRRRYQRKKLSRLLSKS
jgi:hypothetical protein